MFMSNRLVFNTVFYSRFQFAFFCCKINADYAREYFIKALILVIVILQISINFAYQMSFRAF